MLFLVLAHVLGVVVRVGGVQEVVSLAHINNCTKVQYFDYETFSCRPCGPGYLRSDDGLSCECASSQRLVTSIGTVSVQHCLPCGPTEYLSTHRTDCVKRNCSNTISSKLLCNFCRRNQIIVTHATNGSLLPVVQCITCVVGTEPSPDRSQCVPCTVKMANSNFSLCSCDSKTFTRIGGVCVPNDFTKNYQITAKSPESHYFKSNWVLANYLCSLKNKTSCQVVGNLCVLSLYDLSGEESPCRKWKVERNTAAPTLLYGEDEAYSVLLKKKIPVVYSLYEDSELHFLNITAIAYHLNGTSHQVQGPVSKWLLPCASVWKFSDRHMFKFAQNYRHRCKIGIRQLVQQSDTIMYEPYLHFVGAEGPALYAVPVLLRGAHVRMNEENDINSWQLVRRFYLFDTTSGAEAASNNTLGLKYFRYAKKIHVNVRIRRKGREERNKIYPPLLIVEYGEVSAEDITADRYVEMEVTVHYELDGGSMVGSMEIAVGSLSAFGILYSLLQTWSLSRRSGKSGFDVFTLLNFLLMMAGNLSNIFFIVAFGASTFSYILFKSQQSVYSVPPPEKDEVVVEQYIIIAFSLKIVEVVAMNWSQINVDICFIDWEKPNPKPNELDLKLSSGPTETGCSFWRWYFVANEWNEIQTLRKVCLPSHLVACVFVLEVFGVSSWTSTGVSVSNGQPDAVLTTPAYQLALAGLVFLFLYFIQLVGRMFVYERFVNNFIQDFMDICSISNVSMLILDSQYHGYYLHGRCVLATCDNDTRGLLPELPYTAFVVRCTPEFRLCYNRLSIHMVTKDEKWEWQHHLASARDNGHVHSSTLTGLQTGRKSSSRREDGDSRISNISPLSQSLSKREQAHRLMNRFLTAFFDHALEDLDYDVREKRWVEKLLDVELMEETGSSKTLLFYNTTGDSQSFQRSIWYGQEWTLATFDLYLFCFVLLLSGSYLLAALANGVVWKVMSVGRQYGGKKNLAKKTLVDERFLV